MKEVEELLGYLESGYTITAKEYAETVRQALKDDRARRIRELVREWVGGEHDKMHCLAADSLGRSVNEQALEIALRQMRGHIVGSVEVYGYAQTSSSPWYVPDSLAILVRDPRPLAKAAPAKGALGWWTVPESALSELRNEISNG